jgi:hypothetical protein
LVKESISLQEGSVTAHISLILGRKRGHRPRLHAEKSNSFLPIWQIGVFARGVRAAITIEFTEIWTGVALLNVVRV